MPAPDTEATADPDAPAQVHPGLLRPADERAVEREAAHAPASRPGEGSFGHDVAVHVADAAKRVGLTGTQLDAEAAQTLDGVGHHALAARLVESGLKAFENRHPEPGGAGGERGGETGRPASDDGDVHRRHRRHRRRPHRGRLQRNFA